MTQQVNHELNTPKTNSPKAWLLATRPKTLTGACIPVLTATALAVSDGRFQLLKAAACFLFACLMQVAANLINDLFDYLKGTDGTDRLGPERACAQGWISPSAMRVGIGLTLVMACTVGLTLLIGAEQPWALVAIGVACVAFAFLYTTLLSYCGGGDVLVIVFFGLVPVLGCYYIQTGLLTTDAVIVAFACGILTDTLLILNNYRDRETDASSGKRTLIVLFGERFGRYSYLVMGIVAWILCLVLLFRGRVWAGVLPVLYLPLHVCTWKKMIRIFKGRQLNQILGETSRNMILFAILLFLGILMG